MMRRMRMSLRIGMERDRAGWRRHWVIYLAAGLLNLGLVLWALLSTAQALAPEDAGQLLSLRYDYGSFFGGDMDFTLERAGDGQLFLRATPGNGLTLKAYGPVGEEALEELSALLAAEGIFAWDGFQESEEDILDGFSFGLEAVFEGGTLTAGGYERYPAGFEEAHAALTGYLTALAESIPAPEVRGPEDLEAAWLYFAEGFSIAVSPERGESFARADYRHGPITAAWSAERVAPEEAHAFLTAAVDFYNARKESGATGGDFALRLATFQNGEPYDLDLSAEPGVPDGEAQAALKAQALALTGRPADFADSEAFALEQYKDSFIYPVLLLYDPEELGEVWVNLAERTVTVDGQVRHASQEAMRRFADAVDSDSLRFPFTRDSRIMEEEGTDPLSDPQAWWKQLLRRQGYGWLLGHAHRNGYTGFLYGGQETPAGWEAQIREPLRALLAEAE